VINQSINQSIVFKAEMNRNCDRTIESIVRSSELRKTMLPTILI